MNTISPPSFSNIHFVKGEIKINQRELIMKILSRYSGRFTVLRELIQNANDSKATEYEITLFPDKKQIHISHNGFVFRQQDWERITTVASGNPDENTIGCFGVGFYSVFSISEFPTIISGNQMLQFRFEDDQLITKMANTTSFEPNTTFVFEHVEADIFEDLNSTELPQFLTRSLFFSTSILTITFQKSVFSRKIKESMSMPFSNCYSNSEIQAKVQSCTQNICTFTQSSEKIQLSCSLELQYSGEFKARIKKFLTKRMPKVTTLYILIDNDGSSGNVFISYRTQQTTGFGIDINAQFIPTVERENIDFNEHTIRSWNQFLLANVGRLLRFYYDQMLPENPELISNLLAHVPSTPLPQVSQLIQSHFFEGENIFLATENKGVVQADKVLFIPQKLLDNNNIVDIINVPFVTNSTNCPEKSLSISQYIRGRKKIKEFSASSFELALSPFQESEENVQTLLGFLFNLYDIRYENVHSIKAVCWRLLHFSNIRFFLSKKQYTFPYDKHIIMPKELLPQIENVKKHLKWTPYPIIQWVEFIITNFEQERVCSLLRHLSLEYLTMSSVMKSELKQFLRNKKCIPVRNSSLLFRPEEVYFEDVITCYELNIINIEMKTSNRAFFEDIGIQSEPKVSHILKYLVEFTTNDNMNELFLLLSTKMLQKSEIKEIRDSAFIPCFNTTIKCKPTDVFLYDSLLYDMGFRILKPFLSDSMFASFFQQIGIRSYPSFQEIITNANTIALVKYLIQNPVIFQNDYAKNKNAFLPTNLGLQNYSSCFIETNPFNFPQIDVSLVSYADFLKVSPRITWTHIIDWIRVNPINIQNAPQIFTYLYSRCGDLVDSLDLLREMAFIPLNTISTNPSKHVKCSDIFLPTNRDKFGSILDYVDYGPEALLFLRLCGVKDTPTTFQLIENISKNAQRYFEENKITNTVQYTQCTSYVALLEQISNDSTISDDVYIDAFKNKRIFPAIQKDSTVRLCTPHECVLIDDERSKNIFSPLHCPINTSLESLYFKCGSKWFSSFIEEEFIILGVETDSSLAKQLQKLIITKLPLLLYTKQGLRYPDFKENSDELLDNLKVKVTDTISKNIHYINENYSTDNVSCGYVEGTLWIEQCDSIMDIDFFELSYVLCRYVLCDSLNLLDNVYTRVGMLLTRSFTSLERSGWNIERLQEKACEHKRIRSTTLLLEKHRLEKNRIEEEHAQILLKQKQDEVEKKREMECTQRNKLNTELLQKFRDNALEKEQELKKLCSAERLKIISQQAIERIERDEKSRVENENLKSIFQHDKTLVDNMYNQTKKNQEKLDQKLKEAEQKRKVAEATTQKLEAKMEEAEQNHKVVEVTPPNEPFDINSIIKRLTTYDKNVIHSKDTQSKNLHTQTNDCCQSLHLHKLLIESIDIFCPIHVFSLPESIQFNLIEYQSRIENIRKRMEIQKGCINLCFYPNSNIMAFNFQNSIFLNVAHFDLNMQDNDFFWHWLIIICHELAHNLEKKHSLYFITLLQNSLLFYITKVLQE